LLSNLGHGPNIDLEVNYSSNTYADTDKLGQGWSWNLTHFNLITHQLITSTGQNFYLKKNNNGRWFPLYHKLKDIHIDVKKDCFIITYTNGLRETLNSYGYEITLEQQDGWKVYFLYYPGSHLLHSVTDDEGHNIILQWEKESVTVISRGSEGQSVPVVINTQQEKLRDILLPLQKRSASYGIHFSYKGKFITQVTYPTGLKKIYVYNCADEMKMNLDRRTDLAICVVMKETVNPGLGQPAMITRYQYTNSNSNNHNYLGFNSRLKSTRNTFKDRLFEAPINYTYSTTEDNGIIRELRTYNKYHLLIDEQQISDRTGNKLSEVESFFCRTDQVNGCANSSFSDLPVTYSQPLKVITRLWGNSTDFPATTTEISRYDQQGRVIIHADEFGRLTQVSYCPVRGDAACPPQPHDWFFSDLTESITLYPARTKSVTSSGLLPVTTHNYYHKQFNRSGNDYILVLDHQVQQAGGQKKIITRRYYQDVANPLTYGLLKQLILTGNQQGPSKLNRIETDYYYTKSADNQSKTTYSAVKLEAGNRRLSPLVTTSLFTNHVLQSVDSSGRNTVCYHYDLWDRLIRTDLIQKTPFTVSTHYQYIVSPSLNQIIITAVNKLQSKIIFDGCGRQLMSYGEAISVTGKAIQGKWILKKKTTHDKYWRTASRFVYITDSSGKINSLKVTEDYDDSGRIIYTHLPDGETTVTAYDDADRCVMSYQQSARGRHSVISVTKSNVLYQPVQQWVFPVNNKLLSSLHTLCIMQNQQIILSGGRITKMGYDTFGRLVTATDTLKHVIKRYYNAFGQLTDIVNPIGDSVHYEYDLIGHVVQTWVRPVSGGNYLLSSA
ncbi:MAG: YD repeat-containing protein, partial [Endozoicomonadaceae bacterium]|nr:YD repeat-containing protein [Endozoicomonadaceae bacterium]